MQFKRYKPGDPKISASDLNARASTLEAVSQLIFPRKAQGLSGMFGVVNALKGVPFFPYILPAKVTAASTTVPALPPSVTYKAKSIDGAWEVSAFAAPLYRPYNDVPQILPAAVDSDCLLLLVEKTSGPGFDVQILMVREKLNFEACSSGASAYTFAPGSLDLDDLIVADDSSMLIGEDGNLVVADGWAAYPSEPEAEVLIGDADTQPVVGSDGDVVVRDQDAFLVDPDLFEPLLTSDAGLIVVADAALARSEPAVIAPPEEDVGGGGDAGVQVLDDLNDVDVPAPASGQVLAYSGAVWAASKVQTSMLEDDSVTLAKMQEIATDRLIGRSTAGTGNPEQITCTAAGRALLDDADAAAQRTTLGLGPLAIAERVVKSGDVSTSGTAWANVTGMSFSLAANEVCVIEGEIRHVASNTASGLNLGFTDPAGCDTSIRWEGVISASAGAFRQANADDTGTAQTGTPSTTNPALATFKAHVINGANSGTWQLRFASETADAVTVTIKDKSVMWKKPVA